MDSIDSRTLWSPEEFWSTQRLKDPRPSACTTVLTAGLGGALCCSAFWLLSFVAFVLEETISSCLRCSPLYFFEFVSCSAFLFTGLLLLLLSTCLHEKVGISCWPKVDFVYTVLIALLFLISSIIFAAENGGSSKEIISVVFGILSFVMFVADLVFFVRTNGFPFKKEQNTEPTSGGPAQPEEQKLNPPLANGAD